MGTRGSPSEVLYGLFLWTWKQLSCTRPSKLWFWLLWCPTVRRVHEDFKSTLSRGNLVEASRQTNARAAKCETSKLSQRGWEKEWMNPPSPSLHSFPSSLPSYHQPSSLLNHYSLNNSLCPVKASRQTCTKTRSHLASPPNIQTCTHTPPCLLPIKNPSVTQSPSREREGRWRKWEEKVSHFITFCSLTSPCLGDNTKRDKKDLGKSTWEGDSKGKWSSYWREVDTES